MGDKVTIPPLTQPDNSSFTPALNNAIDELADEFDNVLYRDGSQSLTGHLNLNGNRIFNLGKPELPHEPLRYADIAEIRGERGPSGQLHVGQVILGTSPTDLAVVNSGTPENAILNFVLPPGPQGKTGLPADMTIGTVTTLATGTPATAELINTGSGTYSLNLGIPMGATGSGSSVAWGGVTGTLADQTDLKTALDAKASLTGFVMAGNITMSNTNQIGFRTAASLMGAYVVMQADDNLVLYMRKGDGTYAPVLASRAGQTGTNLTIVADSFTFNNNPVAGLNSPAFTGNPTAPTQALTDSSTKLATTAFVEGILEERAVARQDAELEGFPTYLGRELGFRQLFYARNTNVGFTLNQNDSGGMIYFNGGASTVTVPNDPQIREGAVIVIFNEGTGPLTVARSGVTLRMSGDGANTNRTIAQFGMASLIKLANDFWVINGVGVS